MAFHFHQEHHYYNHSENDICKCQCYATRPQHTSLPALDRFIKPLKEKRFIVVKQCVTITGTVVWTYYFNDDGDANFNVALDAPYKNILAAGNYDVKYVLYNKPP
ncbi:MAG: hypothetical protein JO327_07845 [Nitrososphaeraceae archaeon]|nr:hypothetical protein [Nitrososphaeraceae archaeon]MBV9668027.1 hypothetical protein [Nitrososphaeraceae archaeon]